MTISISLFWIIIILIVIHTEIQHLLSWVIRSTDEKDIEDLAIFGTVLEFAVLCAILASIIP